MTICNVRIELMVAMSMVIMMVLSIMIYRD